MAYDMAVSKSSWGTMVSILLGIIAQIVPIPESWRWWITGVCLLALAISVIGWFFSKDKAGQSQSIPQQIGRSEITDSNVASAGRDVYQTIYHPPSKPDTTDQGSRDEIISIVNEAVRLIREDDRRNFPLLRNFPLRALQIAGVGNLNTEDDFAQARERMIQHGFPDPVVGISALYGPGNEPQWLAVIKWANRNQVRLENWSVLMDCAERYMQPEG